MKVGSRKFTNTSMCADDVSQPVPLQNYIQPHIHYLLRLVFRKLCHESTADLRRPYWRHHLSPPNPRKPRPLPFIIRSVTIHSAHEMRRTTIMWRHFHITFNKNDNTHDWTTSFFLVDMCIMCNVHYGSGDTAPIASAQVLWPRFQQHPSRWQSRWSIWLSILSCYYLVSQRWEV